MPTPAPDTWLILVAAYLAASMAWSSRAVAPTQAGSEDPLDTGEPRPAPDDPQLRRPLFGRDRLWRMVLDMAVGAVVAWAALRWAPVATPVSVTWHGYLAALAAGLGHALPVWRPLRGGTGAPVLVGALVVLWPWATPWVLGAGLLVILATGYLSLAVVSAMAVLPLLAWWTDAPVPRLAFALAAAALVAVRTVPALRAIARGDHAARFSRLRLLVRLRRP